jgi:hypothetical protein
VSGLTEASAIELAESGFWEGLTYRERAGFQLFEERLCMPFDVFHEAIEQALGRPVFTHEFGLNVEGLRAEFLGEAPPPTFQEIVELIPEEKRVLVVLEEENGPA